MSGLERSPFSDEQVDEYLRPLDHWVRRKMEYLKREPYDWARYLTIREVFATYCKELPKRRAKK